MARDGPLPHREGVNIGPQMCEDDGHIVGHNGVCLKRDVHGNEGADVKPEHQVLDGDGGSVQQS